MCVLSMIKLFKYIGQNLVVIFLFGCADIIEYSPYDISVASEHININAIGQIVQNTDYDDTVKIALFSDSHVAYDELYDAINHINQHDGLQFVICCGDITDRGLYQEFEWYREIISHSRYPVITVIGNHDYRSNGLKIYEKMFGPSNMSFTFLDYNFIMFDDIVWENNNKSPRFDWLQVELTKNNSPGILITHIPPWSDQIEGLYTLVFEKLISESNLILCLYGHQHAFTERFFAGVPAIVSNNISDKEYYIIKLYGIHYKIELIKF